MLGYIYVAKIRNFSETTKLFGENIFRKGVNQIRNFAHATLHVTTLHLVILDDWEGVGHDEADWVK